jgi:phosphomannomutase / phosphoglucomutase
MRKLLRNGRTLFKMDTSFFHAYDIRGLIDKELNEETAERLGKAFGTLVKGQPVVVGRDIRFSSKKIAPFFIKGLVSSGCDVTDIGECASPILFYNAVHLKKIGAMITASHNPAVYTGFKFVEPSGLSFLDQYKEMAEIYDKGAFAEGSGKVEEVDGYSPYRDFLKSIIKINPDKKIKVAVECLYASGGAHIPRLYEELGLEVIPMHAEPKPDFNNERPEPKGENLKETGKVIVQQNADFGVGLDGDCDRSVIIDDKGRELNGSISSAVFIKDILPKHPEGRRNVVMTVDCNSELKPLVEGLGGQLFWSEVGHSFIGQAVHENKAVYGGEMSSHMWFEHYVFSDGFICGLKMAELLSNSDKKLSELADEIDFAPTMKEYVDCGNNEKKEKIIASLIENAKKQHPDATLTRDGIKFFLNDIEWVMLRKSNNMPEVCIVIEAKDEERKKQLHREYRKVVDEVVASV